MNRSTREIASQIYLQKRLRRRLVGSVVIALLITSAVLAHIGDDWSRFDHQTFKVVRINSGESLGIALKDGRVETVKLMGIASPDARAVDWLNQHVLSANVTLLLPAPQTRDDAGRLQAFVFIDHQNLSVDLAKEGLAFADRREKTVMDGLIDPAEAEARKKKRGMWATMTDNQLPAWRKDWLRSFPTRRR